MAELSLRRGDPEAAIAGYRHLLRNHPDHFEAHYGLARALLEVGGRGQARDHLERFASAVDALPDELTTAELRSRREATREVLEDLTRES